MSRMADPKLAAAAHQYTYVLTTGGAKLRRATYTYDIMSLGDHAKSRKAKQSEGERARAVIKGYVRDKRSVAPCPSAMAHHRSTRAWSPINYASIWR
jgi:hypothetical protein